MAHDPHAHASADDEYLNPPSGSGHEHTDANVSMIIQFAVWLTVSAIVVHILMWFTFAIFVDLRENTGPPQYPLAAEQVRVAHTLQSTTSGVRSAALDFRGEILAKQQDRNV